MTAKRVLLIGCIGLGLQLACSSKSPSITTGDAGVRDAATDTGGPSADAGRCTATNAQGSTANGKACCGNSDCGSGFCVDGVCCNQACQGKCQSCNLVSSPGSCSQVPDGVAARASDCATTDPSTCGQDGTCDGQGACRTYPQNTMCDPGTCAVDGMTGVKVCDGKGSCQIGSDKPCTPYACVGKACNSSCTKDSDCSSGVVCSAGKCGLLPTGRGPCAKDDECLSNHCADGICCGSACAGECVSCNQSQFLGQCRSIGEGKTDPMCTRVDPSTCGKSGACDGFGTCALYKPETACIPATCSGTTANTAGTCDGLGTCRPPGQVDCTPFICGASACLSVCKTNNDCVSPNLCNTATGRCGPGSMGATCTSAAQCQSGNCVDGVCCDSACTGACMSCKLQSALGRCTTVSAGEDDPHKICKDMLASSCGTNAKCDGNGGCSKYPMGTVCAPETCAGGAYTSPSTCNASNQCLPPPSVTCSPYACNGSKCYDICTQTAGQCVGNNSCVKGSCGLKPPGAQCSAPAECQFAPDGKQYCAQGACCTSPCSDSCQACNLNGTGTCINVANGAKDPQNKCVTADISSCGTNGKCANGACDVYHTTDVCKAPSCSTASTELLASFCSGRGTACPVQAAQSCGVYACTAGTGLCKTSCTTSADCSTGNVCTNGTCGLAPNGAACSKASQCLSSFCTEGVCCNTACSTMTNGTCMSCSVQGRIGTCSNVPLGGNDPGGRCVRSATTSCGQSGTCDGGGRCDFFDTTTDCRAQSCAASNQTNSAKCDGNGTCSASTIKSCGNYTCNGATCRSSCTAATAATDCKAGIICNSILNTCGVVSANGARCGVDADCASGACVQGTGSDRICCSTACPADSAASPSCFTGQCTATGTGAGTCALKAAGAPCGAPGSCVGSRATGPRTCNAARTCAPAVVTTCAAGDACHNASTCAGGLCSAVTSMPNGTSCSNANVCDGAETCQGGICASGTGLTCATTNPCQTVACNPVSGCVTSNVADGTTCNDGKACTASDRCTGGTCAGTSSCDDGNPCTADACSAAGVCTHVPLATGTTCDDGNACTTGDKCSALGACSGTAKVCTALDQCHSAGTCNATTGVCSNPVSAGVSCDDGNSCTTGEACSSTGACAGGTTKVCTASDQCHSAGTCNTTTGVCSNPVAAGISCDDGNLCTTGETCSSTGTCAGGTAKVCTASDQCHGAGTCNATTGICTNPVAAGVPCDDGNGCTVGETCSSAGLCAGGSAKVCPGVADSCHSGPMCVAPGGACVNPVTAGLPCSDPADMCTIGKTCNAAGNCGGGAPKVCPGVADQCHSGPACVAATGVCVNPVILGNACTDTDMCSTGTTCNAAGNCTGGVQKPCSTPPDDCHAAVGTCQSTTGSCTYAALDGTSCMCPGPATGTCASGTCDCAPPPPPDAGP